MNSMETLKFVAVTDENFSVGGARGYFLGKETCHESLT